MFERPENASVQHKAISDLGRRTLSPTFMYFSFNQLAYDHQLTGRPDEAYPGRPGRAG